MATSPSTWRSRAVSSSGCAPDGAYAEPVRWNPATPPFRPLRLWLSLLIWAPAVWIAAVLLPWSSRRELRGSAHRRRLVGILNPSLRRRVWRHRRILGVNDEAAYSLRVGVPIHWDMLRAWVPSAARIPSPRGHCGCGRPGRSGNFCPDPHARPAARPVQPQPMTNPERVSRVQRPTSSLARERTISSDRMRSIDPPAIAISRLPQR
jgi:hypothetical protein